MGTKTYPIRIRLARDIVAEVMFPKGQTGKVAIVCIGAPSLPYKKDRFQFLVDKGYVVVCPRYRGTWESDGSFLAQSPAKDIEDVIKDLVRKKSVHDLFSGETKRLSVKAVHLFGTSFGGPAVLLNSCLPIVKKVIAISPVIDWSADSPDEPFDWFVHFTQTGFAGAYRTKHRNDWQKLVTTDFYNPITRIRYIDGKKIFIIHAKDDMVVPYAPVLPFAEKTDAAYYLKPHGGHRLDMTHAFLWKKIAAFLKKK